MNKISGIYKILNTKNGKFYIGSSIDIDQRWYKHKLTLGLNKHPNKHLQSAWNKDGRDSFEFIVLEIVDPIKDKIISKEQEWLDKTSSYKDSIGYNLQSTADSPLGMKRSEETKIKIGLTKMGNQNMLGKNHSEETKERIRLAKTGCKLTEEHKLKIGLKSKGNPSWTGKKFTEEHKRKISEASMGRTATPETKERLRIANTGKKASEQTRERLRLSHLGNTSRKPRFTEDQISVFIKEINECGKQSTVAKKYGIAVSTMNYLYKRYSI